MKNEMDMALEIIAAIEELSWDDFIAEYKRITGKNVDENKIKWNGFPVYYDPEEK